MSIIDSPSLQRVGTYLDLAAFRQKLITTNIANIDTPGYRTLDIDFAHEMRKALDGAGAGDPLPRQVPLPTERPDGNNVNVDRESLLLAENHLRFRTGVQVLRSELQRISIAIREGR